MTEQQIQYAAKIGGQISEIFNEDCENYIDPNSMDATDFFYAIAIASNLIYDKLTGEKTDLLGFNHIQNRLICQFKN